MADRPLVKQSTAAPGSPRPKMYLLEHDRRFAVFPEFVFYDYMQPTKLPGKSSEGVESLPVPLPATRSPAHGRTYMS